MRYRRLFLLIFLSILSVASTLASRPGIEDINRGWRFVNPYAPWTERMSSIPFLPRVDLPHDWSIEGPFDKENPSGSSGAYLPGGKALYRKDSIHIPKEWEDKKIFIEFEGVYQNSELYVNGIQVGKRPNGWISFWYDITKWIDAGGYNTLAVKVDNSDMPNCRWYTGSGIYRPVRLFATDKLHIKHWGTFVTTPVVEKDFATVDIAVTVCNEYEEHKRFAVRQQVFDALGKEVAERTDEYTMSGTNEREFRQSVAVRDHNLWDIDSPYLYTLKTTILVADREADSYETVFGIRTIAYDADKGFFLNGRSVKMKGVCLHHDGGMLGAAVPDMVWERRLKLLKEMGCNAIRTSHNPFHPAFYDMCDRMGFLVMNELFDEWSVYTTKRVPYGYNLHWDDWWRRDAEDFILRDRNHPSIVMWSAGNEIIEQAWPQGREMARELVDLFHRYDHTRPVTCGNNKQEEANRTGFADEFDVAGYNYGPQFGVYPTDREAFPGRRVVGTESTRGNSTRGFYSFPVPRDGRMVRTPEQYYSSYDGKTRVYGMEYEWQVTQSLDHVAGMFIWTGIDYLGETSFPWPTKYSDFAPVDACGFPKDAYYFYRSVWNDRQQTLHILPHWNWPGREGEITPVWCYTSAEEVELYLNGTSLGRKKMGADGKLHIEWPEVEYQPGEIKAVAYKKGRKVAQTSVRTTGEPSAIVLDADKGKISANGTDVVHITVSTVDREGRYVPTAMSELNHKVTGGKLLGIDSGDPQFVGNFKQLTGRTLFNGLALVIVQADYEPGIITVETEGAGLVSARVEIQKL